MSSPQTTPAIEDLALLPLPDLARLSKQQGRGAFCVWDAVALGADSVDLGQHRIGGRVLFLRACRPCMRAHVRGTAAAHTAMCEHCVTTASAFDDAAVCDTARALQQLVTEYGR